MKTSHGVIQGYTGVASVDSRHQVVVHAEAFGQGQEHGLIKPVVEAIKQTFKGKPGEALKKTKLTADSGYHNREMLESQRLGAVEPVFGHITDAIGIKRFSLRGKRKVDGQWKLVMMLHNILKIHRYGWEWTWKQ